jgi:hypothetical protein
MPALQSFSLPRSGPRVAARPCPPVVLRQRRRDYEALFRSEIRGSDGSWPNRTARCSPGLPRLEPHPIACPRHARERAAMRDAEARANTDRSGGQSRDDSATTARRLRPHRVRGGGRKDGITAVPSDQASGPSAPPPERCPRRSLPLEGRSSSRVGHAAPRESVGSRPRDPSEDASRSDTRGVLDFLAGGTTAEAFVPVCSAAFREVGGRRRGGPRG